MKRSELVNRLSEKSGGLKQRDTETIVDAFFETISQALGQDDRVEIRGFGTFSVRSRGARLGRNPRTGESVAIDGKRVPHFKLSKELRDRMNG